MSIDRRNVLSWAGGLLMAGRARAAVALDVSDWAETDHARLRLIDAGPALAGGTDRFAGIQIELDPSYLTYWRSPGEAGVAPIATFDGSTNLSAAHLDYPAPGRFDEGGAEAFGYQDGVVFPITVTPIDPTRPIGLATHLSFAVCSRLCLPAQAALRLDLAGDGGNPEAGLVREARAQVPVARALGQSGALSVEAVAPTASAELFTVKVRADDATRPSLFVETPEPWFLQADAGTPSGAGRTMFAVRVLAGPKTPSIVTARLTVVAANRAVEVTTQLDGAASKP